MIQSCVDKNPDLRCARCECKKMEHAGRRCFGVVMSRSTPTDCRCEGFEAPGDESSKMRQR